MQQPPLDQQELAILRQSIVDHGVINPVVYDKQGRRIDGQHREQIALEIGIDCPKIIVDIEGEAADRLAMELQLGRRNLDRDTRDRFFVALRNGGMTQQAIADTAGVSVGTVNASLNFSSENESSQNSAISGKPTQPRHVKTSRGYRPTSYQRRKRNPALDVVKKNNHETQMNSMRNAPANKLNLSGLRLAREIESKLRELATLDADKFLTQVPAEACRDFDPANAEYWSRWVELCTNRADEEQIPERRRVKAKGPLAAMPKGSLQERVLEVLRRHPAGLTPDQLSNELLGNATHIGRACLRLSEMGLLACDRRQRPHLYRATLAS